MDPVEAAIEALVAHLKDELPGITCRVGFPEIGNDFDLGNGHYLTAEVVGDPETTPRDPLLVAENLYRISTVSLRVQVDLWCAYKAQRDEVAPTVSAALSNQMPRTPALWIDSTDHYGRPVTFRRVTTAPKNDAVSAVRGEWRRRWVLIGECDECLVHTTPLIRTATGVLTTIDATGVTITGEAP